jgi:hypothetical protein
MLMNSTWIAHPPAAPTCAVCSLAVPFEGAFTQALLKRYSSDFSLAKSFLASLWYHHSGLSDEENSSEAGPYRQDPIEAWK